MGRVFRARHVTTGAERAIKVLEGTPDEDAVARFVREGRSVAQLGGAGVVQVHESGHESGRFYLVMDLMPGGSVRGRLRAEGSYTWQEAARLGAALARTLARCHERGLVHRDVKPDNILIDDQGEPRLADFGCVRDLGATRLTQTGTALGTPPYMAPEVLDGGRAGPPSDVYSLGVVLYELVSGSLPYRGSAFAVLRDALDEKRAPLPAEVPPAFAALVARALSAKGARRPSASSLARDLEAILAGKAAARPRLGVAVFVAVAIGGAAIGGTALALRLKPLAAPGPPRPAAHVDPGPPAGNTRAPFEDSPERRAKVRLALEKLGADLTAMGSGVPASVRTMSSVVHALGDLDPGSSTYAGAIEPLTAMMWQVASERCLSPKGSDERSFWEKKRTYLLNTLDGRVKAAPPALDAAFAYLRATRLKSSGAVVTHVGDRPGPDESALRQTGRAMPRECPVVWRGAVLAEAADLSLQRTEGSLAHTMELLEGSRRDLEGVLPDLAAVAAVTTGDMFVQTVFHESLVLLASVEERECQYGDTRGHLLAAEALMLRTVEHARKIELPENTAHERLDLVKLSFRLVRYVELDAAEKVERDRRVGRLRDFVDDGTIGGGTILAAEVARLSGDHETALKVAASCLASADTAVDRAHAMAVIVLTRIGADRDLTEAGRVLDRLEAELNAPARVLDIGVTTAELRRRLEARRATAAPR
jgi:serine/threonine-protein kinase